MRGRIAQAGTADRRPYLSRFDSTKGRDTALAAALAPKATRRTAIAGGLPSDPARKKETSARRGRVHLLPPRLHRQMGRALWGSLSKVPDVRECGGLRRAPPGITAGDSPCMKTCWRTSWYATSHRAGRCGKLLHSGPPVQCDPTAPA